MALLRWIEWLIRLVVLAWIDLRGAGVRRILLPYFLAQVLLLQVCADPVSELWAGAMVPLISTAFGDYHLHYPQSYIGLPLTGSAARVVMELLLGPFVLAWCAWAVRARLEGRRFAPAELRRLGRTSYPSFFLLGVLQLVVWIAAYGLPLLVLSDRGGLSYRIHSALTLMGGAIPVLLLVPLFYTIPHLVYEEQGLRAALAGSVRRFRSQWFTTLYLAMIPWLVGLPFHLVLQRSARIASKLRPEMVLVVMAVQALVAILVTFFVLDVAMRLYRRRGSEAR